MVRESKHANDVQFTEDSLKGFIKKIRNNIRDNLMFASTSDMAQKIDTAYDLITNGILNNTTYQFNIIDDENQSIYYKVYNNSEYIECTPESVYNFNTFFLLREQNFTKGEEEIASYFPYNDPNNSWNATHVAEICIINKEIPYDSTNLENGRYTWIMGGSLFTFQEELSNIINESDRPIGTIWIDENNGTKTHVILVKGFDNSGNFNNRNPSDYNENAVEPFNSITTNDIYADTITADTAIFNELSLGDGGDGLYIHNTNEAYRRSGIRTYNEWTQVTLSDDSFADYNIIQNVPYQQPIAPSFTVTNIDGTQPYTLTDEYYQSGSNNSPKVSSCKINFQTDRPVEVEIIYQNDGYTTKNYTVISDLNKDLSTSASADSQWIALNLKSNFSTEDRIYSIYIPAGESYIICKHIIGSTSYNKGYFKFKVNFKEITQYINTDIQYYTHPTSQPTQVEFHPIPFVINSNNFYIQKGTNKWETCLNDKLYNYNTTTILHKFTGGQTFEYIGEDPFVSFPALDDLESWELNYNLSYPLWFEGPNESIVARISKPLLSNEMDYIYAAYNSSTKGYDYYRITDIIEPTIDISEIEYTFTQIETPADISLYSSPSSAIMFKQGNHYDFQVGSSIQGASGDWITYQIDDTIIKYQSSDTTLDDPDGIHSLVPVELDFINNINIIDTTNKKYFKLDYDLTNLFIGNLNDNPQYIPLEYGIDYSNQLNNFYRQTSFDNLETMDDDPALYNDNPYTIEGSIRTDGGIAAKKSIKGYRLHGAVFNDYAEFRETDSQEPGRCVIEIGDGNMTLSSKRLQAGANIISDTFGFSIGETRKAQTPIAVCGRVLAYPLEDKEVYEPGDAVCSGPNGTISKMTREEIKEWPDRIVGYVSEIPSYGIWGSDQVKVNGRIWIKIK